VTRVSGHDGDDTLTVADSVEAGHLEVRGGAGNDTIDASAVPAGAELALIGGLGEDTLTGGEGGDVIFGDEAVLPATRIIPLPSQRPLKRVRAATTRSTLVKGTTSYSAASATTS